ncbi:MAG: hypothetical protein QOD09_4979 [Bradyrhizobium sp.]|jgi:hypothetical protein|nr:hypothetical protein [Bradyrhizobium sp.]MEA2953547.1 hypothetical protein [Alphaproteobacteria bacterium]
MIRLNAPYDSAGSEGEAESRAYRRIVDALERDDIDELAAALGQVPDPAWHAPDSPGGRRISQGGRQKSGSLWSGLRRLATRLQPRRPS